MAELLVWPALIAYGEAAVAYAGELRGPGLSGRLATWGVRIGWLAQTAILVVQALQADGFPWGSWAGALNLLVWLVVGAYLIWGCKPRYRLLGLAVMPPATALLVASWAGGGTGAPAAADAGWLLAAHAGLILAAFAAFTLAAAMAALYLWEDGRLSARDARLLRLRVPPLAVLDRLAARASGVGLALLTAGIVVGLARMGRDDVDAAVLVTLLVWAVFAAVLVLRREVGLRGRRSASILLGGFALVAVLLPLTHFAS